VVKELTCPVNPGLSPAVTCQVWHLAKIAPVNHFTHGQVQALITRE